MAISLPAFVMASETKPSPGRHPSWRAKRSHLLAGTCHGERSEAISLLSWRLLRSQRALPRNDTRRCLSWRVKRSRLRAGTCHGERSEAISWPGWGLLRSQSTLPRNDTWRCLSWRAKRSHPLAGVEIASVAKYAPSQ